MFNICCFPKATVVMQSASKLCCLSHFSSKCVWVSNLLFYTTAWLILFGCFRRGSLRILAVFKSKTQAADVSSREFFFWYTAKNYFYKICVVLEHLLLHKIPEAHTDIASCKKFCTTFMLVLFEIFKDSNYVFSSGNPTKFHSTYDN